MYKLAAIFWFGLSNYLFFIPANKLGIKPWFLQFKHSDKLVHTTIFFILSFLLLKAFTNSTTSTKYWALGLLLYGILVELIQKYFIPSRSFDLVDIVADGIGIALALIFISKLTVLKNHNHAK